MVSGFDQVIGSLQRMLRTKTEYERLLEEEADKIKAVSDTRVPVLTGKLKRSGKRHPAETHGDETSVLISYGGDNAPYAVYVHENLGAKHPNGQEKFLESAVLEHANVVGKNIGARIVQIWQKR